MPAQPPLPAALPACSRPVPSVTTAASVVAQGLREEVGVYAGPEAGRRLRSLKNPQPSGAALVFLVLEESRAMYKVLLPVRPNGATGWVRRSEVTISSHDYRIVVELDDHCITVFKGVQVFLREPVGVGRGNTPTPGGLYYLKELYRPPDQTTMYGPFAYSLSGFSDALTRFQGGEAVIGIHGNNDASSLGRDVSAGCIRMSNPAIMRLATVLPLGVPVEIRQ